MWPARLSPACPCRRGGPGRPGPSRSSQMARLAQSKQTPEVGWRPRAAAAGGRPQAGLEFVEKLLTTTLTSTDTMERNAGMLRLRTVALPHRPEIGRAHV